MASPTQRRVQEQASLLRTLVRSGLRVGLQQAFGVNQTPPGLWSSHRFRPVKETQAFQTVECLRRRVARELSGLLNTLDGGNNAGEHRLSHGECRLQPPRAGR